MLSSRFIAYLKKERTPVKGVPHLFELGQSGGLETPEALHFLAELYRQVRPRLQAVLKQRQIDRDFIDQRTRACVELNRQLKIDFLDPRYETVLGHVDGKGRTVAGPLHADYFRATGRPPVATIPAYLAGNHVTLFGPPDDAKLSINAMNAYHRRLPDEPSIVEDLLHAPTTPKWGADDEDSKTPLRKDLIAAGVNLAGSIDRTLTYTDPKSQKRYELAKDHLVQPIKRFPGLALPCTFLFYDDEPMPLHLYDFALHLFAHWNRPQALAFYVPKLENEEEAAYVHFMMESAEELIQKIHPNYKMGTIRLMIVLENPRAIFRAHEIIDALYPYFVGASLGWHDYLASTARLFKEDPHYRIPVKADPQIVIRYIKASHDLLNEVVGSRGGIKVGGMYGVLPIQNDVKSDSFQQTLKGFIRDVVIQLKRGLDGFWVAHPDFVRIGLAMVEAWKIRKKGNSVPFEKLVTSLLLPAHHVEILEFIRAPDLNGLDPSSPLYARSLIVADIKESTYIANNHPDEIRYNVFQSLQYLTDWLCGNGCVALPAQINGIPVRVMDDLATAERSRWEVWHELRHGRFSVQEFLKIAHEEMLFIRKDRSDGKKIVQVKYDERTERWYPIAMRLMIQLMTDREPPEFATELLMPFTVESIRNAADPWKAANDADPGRYQLPHSIERFNELFEACGSVKFASALADDLVLDLDRAREQVLGFELQDILDAAGFHGDIGESKKTLDAQAASEQAGVLKDSDEIKAQLRALGTQYLAKFGFKYLISAQGKTAPELLANLTERLQNTREQELQNAREALWAITQKRLSQNFLIEADLRRKIEASRQRHRITGAQIAISTTPDSQQTLCFGDRNKNGDPVTPNTWFELASLSKTIASAFAIDQFTQAGIQLNTSVNSLLKKWGSSFKLDSDAVQLRHLMNHQALNMHYVNGIPLDLPMPSMAELLDGNSAYGYMPVKVQNVPGTAFQYSGGGFLVLEHLMELMGKQRVQDWTRPYLTQLGLNNTSFEQKSLPDTEYAHGYLDDGKEVPDSRLMFPAFAAGALGTATDYLKFLQHLHRAYQNSESTALEMLWDKDRASQKFMGVNIGLGVFVAEAGANRLAVHQGANDGFRCLNIYCYKGPDQGKGFVILCNGNNNAVAFVAEVAQLLLTELGIQGIDTSLFSSKFDPSQIRQEEVVNLGYKTLCFSAFEPDLPEPIVDRGPPDPLASYNVLLGARVVECSDQRFARAENLVSDRLPKFDVELYGRQGKIMDSWESVRHNFKPSDHPRDILVLELKKPSRVRYAQLSTAYHHGNQAPVVSIEGRESANGDWMVILEKTPIEGHSIKKILLPESVTQNQFAQVRVSMYPDGGFSRLGLYEDLPADEKPKYLSPAQAQSQPVAEPIPQPVKPLTPRYAATPQQITANLKALKPGEEFDIAGAAFGGRIVRATNEHYSPAVQVISPYPPLNMFDGAESARSRKPGNFEEVVIALARPAVLHRIELDFAYFRNNNPHELLLSGLLEGSSDQWIDLTPKMWVKPFAGHRLELTPQDSRPFTQLKVTVFPDGGFNRIRAYTRAE